MSGYSDAYKDDQQERFIKEWGPKRPLSKEFITYENMVHNIARANKAEHELNEIKKALSLLVSKVR